MGTSTTTDAQHEPKRDFVGYGNSPPPVRWPNGARLAVSLVANYEEGSERSFAFGDDEQESMTEWGGYVLPPSVRNLAMESMYEYGSRVGVWRILRVLDEANVKATFYACAKAFEAAPNVAKAVVAAGHEVCSHGYRWEEVFRLSREEERAHILQAIESFQQTTGKRPVGWYCRYGPSVHTRELLVEEGGFLYDSDAYNDDIPYFVQIKGHRHLVIPYTADNNDFRFWNTPGLTTGAQLYEYLKRSFDTLYAEGVTQPKLMSVGLHMRIVGTPGRISALRDFISYAQGHDNVWFATREEIARHWIAQCP